MTQDRETNGGSSIEVRVKNSREGGLCEQAPFLRRMTEGIWKGERLVVFWNLAAEEVREIKRG